MLTESDLAELCNEIIAAGGTCPANRLSREGCIDLATYAQHRIEHNREQPSESTDGTRQE